MKSLLFILAVFIVFTGCKKYPEDEALVHLKRPEKRLCNKKLQFMEYKIDGIDSIPYVNSQLYGSINLLDVVIQTGTNKYMHTINPYSELVMEMSKDKTQLRIWHKAWQGGLSYPVFFQNESNYWEIKRLEKNSLIVEIFKNSKLYRIEFKIT